MQCRQCSSILDSSDSRCSACGLERPAEGWIPLPEAVIAPNRPQVSLPPAPSAPLDEEDVEDPDTEDEAQVPVPTLDEFDDEIPTAVGRPGTLRVRVAPRDEDDEEDDSGVVVALPEWKEGGLAAHAGRDMESGRIFARRYRIDERLAGYANASDYLAVQEPMVRRVVLTVLNQAHDGELQADLESRFLRECAVLARSDHANLAAVFDSGRSGAGYCYVASEVVYGFTLREVLQRSPLPAERLVPIFVEVVRGLVACHEAGVIHRALRAENVVLDMTGGRGIVEGRARLKGYGFHYVPENLQDGLVDEEVRCLAPELVEGMEPDELSDIYAFGALLYQAVAGRPPFEGDVQDVMLGHLEKPVPGLEELVEEGRASPELVAIMQRCLQKAPGDRYLSAAALLGDLEPLVPREEEPVAPIPVVAPVNWRVVLVAAVAGALVPTLLLGAFGGWRLMGQQPAVQPVVAQ